MKTAQQLAQRLHSTEYVKCIDLHTSTLATILNTK